jgi:YHS domain-containing protein
MIILVRLILLLILALMAVRSLLRFLAGIAAGVAPERTQRPPQQVMGHMVKDPVCGTYVVEGRALTAARNGQTAWFCSPECQHAWLQGKAS